MQIFKSDKARYKLSLHAFYQQVNTVKPEIRTPPLAKQLCMSSYIIVALFQARWQQGYQLFIC
jgi:hypothetical protein